MGKAERRGCVVLDCGDKSGGKLKKKKKGEKPTGCFKERQEEKRERWRGTEEKKREATECRERRRECEARLAWRGTDSRGRRRERKDV